MTPDESRQALDAIVAATTARAGGEWEVTHLAAEQCTLAGGSTGVTFPIYAEQPEGATDPRSVLESVRELWMSEYGVATAEIRERDPAVGSTELSVPRSDDSLWISLRVSFNAMSISSDSQCVPGDAQQINRDRDSQ
jgi:hypothetical protein